VSFIFPESGLGRLSGFFGQLPSATPRWAFSNRWALFSSAHKETAVNKPNPQAKNMDVTTQDHRRALAREPFQKVSFLHSPAHNR
jgi:hypothetical protein